MSTQARMILTVALLIAALTVGLIALYRVRRLRRRIDQHERAVAILAQARRPPPDGGREPHLRVAAVWVVLATAGVWLLARLAAHSTQVAAAAFIASAATVTTLVVSQSAVPPTTVSLPPQPTVTTTADRPPGRAAVGAPTASAGDTTAAAASRTHLSIESSAQPVPPPTVTTSVPPQSSTTTTTDPPVPTISPTCVALAPLSIDLPTCVGSVLNILGD